jgi:protease I
VFYAFLAFQDMYSLRAGLFRTSVLFSNHHFKRHVMAKPIAVVLVEEHYECLEFHYPRLRLIEAGYDVRVVAPEAGKTYKSKEGYWGKSTHTVSQISPQEPKVVVIPGGFCTDILRRHKDINEWLHAAYAGGNGAVVSFICHGGWLPISAKIVKGRKVTCFPAIVDDLENAGAHVDTNARCVVDGRMVTAQTPDDLPAFMTETLKVAATL